jgi:transposase
LYIIDADMVPPDEAVRLLPEVMAELAALKAENAWLRRQLFGPGKSEKLDRLQTTLPLAEPAAALVEPAVETITYERLAAPRQKRPLPEETFRNVPVKETLVIEPEEVKAKPADFERIGEERTFEIDLTPPQIFKREIVRPKYRHKADRSRPPVIAPALERAVVGGYASAGLLAWVALCKYVDHQPLYRLEKQSARWGAAIPRQTMADWIRITAEWLEPVYRQMAKRLLAGGYLQADETPIRCNDPDEKRGGTTEGWLWVISRPGEDVIFDWRLSRRHGELTSLIEGYNGLLQSDGYAAYEAYARDHKEITWLCCWAHARRKFFEAEREWPKAARVILRIIGWLYECEAKWDEHKLTDVNRSRHRQKHYRRPLYWLRKLATGVRERMPPKSGLAKACDYLLRFWDPLVRHLEYGQTRLDTNLVENAIRPSAIGKKNWLFIGHPDAGQRSAIIYSIVVSCQRRGIDPLAYLRDVLTRLPRMTTRDDLDALTPARWSQAA